MRTYTNKCLYTHTGYNIRRSGSGKFADLVVRFAKQVTAHYILMDPVTLLTQFSFFSDSGSLHGLPFSVQVR